jgi:hypothetical protein
MLPAEYMVGSIIHGEVWFAIQFTFFFVCLLVCLFVCLFVCLWDDSKQTNKVYILVTGYSK